VRHLDTDGALADRRGDALHVPGAHVAYGEHAGDAGLQHVRRALERPMRLGQVCGGELRAGADEAFVVEADAVFQPSGIRNRARYQENVRDIARLPAVGAVPRDALELAGPLPRRVATALGYSSRDAFLADYRQRTAEVRAIYTGSRAQDDESQMWMQHKYFYEKAPPYWQGIVGWYVGYDGSGCLELVRNGNNVTLVIPHG